MKKGQRPSKHIRRVRTKRGRRKRLINPRVRKRRKMKRRRFGAFPEEVGYGETKVNVGLDSGDVEEVERFWKKTEDAIDKLKTATVGLRRQTESMADDTREQVAMGEYLTAQQENARTVQQKAVNARIQENKKKELAGLKIRARNAENMKQRYKRQADRILEKDILDVQSENVVEDLNERANKYAEQIFMTKRLTEEVKALQTNIDTKKEFIASVKADRRNREAMEHLEKQGRILNRKIRQMGIFRMPKMPDMKMPKMPSFNRGVFGVDEEEIAG